jgi:hypothetical protein
MTNNHAAMKSAMAYQQALGLWYARMFHAGRTGQPFDQPRPQPQDFKQEPSNGR